MSETLTDPLLGRLIDGRYEVRDRVAIGGMATVYVAFDRRLEREVALKVMHSKVAEDADAAAFASRVRREARAAARLTHPGMVRVYDQGVDGDISYLTMEYVDGENLRHRMAQELTLSLGESLSITEQVLDALAAAHRQGLVHRDVKPENVLIDEDGRAKVADFGLARAVTDVSATAPTGVIMGTVAYLGPELVSRGEADARTDVYAVGVLLFEMLTGRQPFTGDTPVDVATRHVHEDVPAPSSFVPWLPPELDDLVQHLASRSPDARPADAAAALALVRQTRAIMDDPTLDRRADPPSGAVPVDLGNGDATTVLDPAPSGATVALPVGLAALADDDVVDAIIVEDDPEAISPAPTRNKAGLWIGAIIAAILTLLALGLWWYTAIGPGAYTTVPNVDGQSAEQAENILTAAGFVVSTDSRNDDAVPEGFAIETEPGQQSRVLNGSDITLVVSLGPRMVEVPTLVGIQEADALAALQDADLTAGEIARPYSDTVPQGQVMEASLEAGASVRHSTPVNLTVSNGPEPISIPDVYGLSEEEARDVLAGYALNVTVEYGRTEDVDKGEVYLQDPAATSDGFRTQAVTITVSEGLPLVTVDDYVGMDAQGAQKAAKDAGLKVTMYGKWPWSSKESIVDQSLTPGQEVEKGTAIVLIYN
ncbi:Stk1 family PASTA domain-containing Ser/Thr kinase [Demequina sp. NBRC 110052]|uniref:Stk1 family PASTA domain-containing Ser/Thr kinase n=1 Tax=Demequina sp. NBRC 110052 TaxID=1570341 RepID=UPI0011800E60|nr:Stk1 family PASTA domain-containing Ser/Thr kinase [Demequina sp. NBRC 110052]